MATKPATSPPPLTLMHTGTLKPRTPFDRLTTQPLTPEQQAERDRLQAEIDRLNEQIGQVWQQIEADLETIYSRRQNGNKK